MVAGQREADLAAYERRRDALVRRLRGCRHYADDACRGWAQRVGRLTAGDGEGARRLHDEFAAPGAGHRRDLESIRESVEGPGLGAGLSLLAVATPSLWPAGRDLRAQIRSCAHLREDVRREWLADAARPDRLRSKLLVEMHGSGAEAELIAGGLRALAALSAQPIAR
jgi:hypothetical protein